MSALLAFLPSWAQGWALKAAIVALIIILVIVVYMRGRTDGKAAAKLDAAIRSLEAEHVRKKVDVAIARGGADERKRLREKYSRD